ncbi:DUF2155 domain-containing protein [Celeribacter marinus]|uniref:Uncharacterized protein n=1 Tax=Celeribacter marinus TaxID=1397108 RepID=A0A0P0ACL1_9RHOB|nr:hypothetical protein IMCC12053_2195 [Celeribacter marinus]SFK86529.1 hypothetical protein SAMN05444421_109163 [Celeribacter marinus]
MITRALMMSVALIASTGAAQAQDAGFTDDLQTGIGSIIETPLDDSAIGFGGLSLEQLQALPDEGFQRELFEITTETQESVASGTGVVIRVLDKLTGRVEDIPITRGQTATWGFITMRLDDCRYPVGNPSGDAYAYLDVSVEGIDLPVFQGWMISSSPALNAMDHPRYDAWVLNCSTS